MARRRLPPDPFLWGIDRIDQRGPEPDGTYRHRRSGAGVDIYVVATGLRGDHEEFGPHPRLRYLFDRRELLPVGDPDYVAPGDPRYAHDDRGLGTAAAATAAGRSIGAAPAAGIVAVAVMDRELRTDPATIDAGLARIEAEVAAKAPGTPRGIVLVPLLTPEILSPIVEARLRAIETLGAPVVIAVGDDSTDTATTRLATWNFAVRVARIAPGDVFGADPARGPSAAGAGGSNYGTAVDILAPGSSVATLEPTDDGSPALGWGSSTGLAAGFVAGILALHQEEDPTASAATLRTRLLDDATVGAARQLPVGTPDRILYSRFSDAWVFFPDWSDPDYEAYEGSWIQKLDLGIDARGADGSSLPYRTTLIAGSLPPGLRIVEDRHLSGWLGTVAPTDPGYVPVSSLPPEDAERYRALGLGGYVDFTFDLQVDTVEGSDVGTWTFRVWDMDAEPVWSVDSIVELGTIVDSDTTGLLPIDLSVYVTEPTGAPLTYTLLAGELPPGLTLSPTGTIAGSVLPVPWDPSIDTAPPMTRRYVFAVRVDDGTWKTDRVFAIDLERTSAFDTPPVWLTPDHTTSLGTGTIGDLLSFPLDATDADGDALTYTLVPITDPTVPPPAPGVNHGLPPGVSLDPSGLLRGVPDENAPEGAWYFQVAVSDGFTSVERAFRFDLRFPLPGDIAAMGAVRWLTPAGHLATFDETEPVWAAIKAESSSAITYDVDPTTPLPPSVVLDPDTGELEGHAPLVATDTVYTFVARARPASWPLYVVERTFSFTVRDRWPGTVCEVALRVTGSDRLRKRARWMWEGSPLAQFLFRPGSDVLGFFDPGEILVVGSLVGPTMADVWAAVNVESPTYTNPPPSYESVRRFRLGTPQVALARDPDTGDVVYEAIWHPVIDTMEKAGGFDPGGTPVPVVFPANVKTGTDPLTTPPTIGRRNNVDFLYPPSLLNMRRDILWDLSAFTSTYERLPLWMRSEQVPGDPASVIGWVPALPVAYCLPGTASEALDLWLVAMEEIRSTVGMVIEVGEMIVRWWDNPLAPTENVVPLFATDPRS